MKRQHRPCWLEWNKKTYTHTVTAVFLLICGQLIKYLCIKIWGKTVLNTVILCLCLWCCGQGRHLWHKCQFCQRPTVHCCSLVMCELMWAVDSCSLAMCELMWTVHSCSLVMCKLIWTVPQGAPMQKEKVLPGLNSFYSWKHTNKKKKYCLV